MFTEEDEIEIRRFLLGRMEEEEGERFETRLLEDPALLDHLPVVEEELIDDYLFGTLADDEREGFERQFLTTPRRREKLMLARRLKEYAEQSPVIGGVKQAGRAREWPRRLFFPAWKAAVLAIVVVGLGFGIWRNFLYQSPADEALLALNQAYRAARPVEVRITGMAYAPFTVQRGPGDENRDVLQRDRADILSRTLVAEKQTAEAYHLRGRFLMTEREYDKATEHLERAAALAPNDAQIQSDLGAAWIERFGRFSEGQDSERRNALDRAIRYLDRALELDNLLAAALFNRALLNKQAGRNEDARRDWLRYLQLDPGSTWSHDARQYLDQLK